MSMYSQSHNAISLRVLEVGNLSDFVIKLNFMSWPVDENFM